MAAVICGAATVFSLVGGTGTASAEEGTFIMMGSGLADCPSGSLCLYQNLDYNAGADAMILVTNQHVPDFRQFDFNDRMSSYYNNADTVGHLYSDAEYSGYSYALSPRHSCPDMSEVGNDVGNDAASSVAIRPDPTLN